MWRILTSSLAQDLVLEGEVPDDGLDHFFVPFEVPAGVAEIEVAHDDASDVNVLDWGLQDPAGWRGWGGGNAENAVVGELAASRSYVPGPVPAGTWSVVVGKAKVEEQPATWRVEIWLRTAPTLSPQAARAPYAPVPALETGPRWYAGDFHVHSTESGDASATLDEIADLARERGLDFVFVTDHNTVTHLDWLLDAQARHPDVLLLPGTEFTTYDGHANALGVTAWVDHKLGQPGVTLESAAEAYAAQGAVLSVNHPALDLGGLCIGCAWALGTPAGPPVGPLGGVEIGNGGWDAAGSLFSPPAIELWDAWCAQGLRLAALGGSDDHDAGRDTSPFASPIGEPVTLVWAEELSSAAILDGVRENRTVVKLQDSGDPMAELAAAGPLSVVVTGGDGHELVWVVDGAPRGAIRIAADPFEATLADVADGQRVRAEVHVAGAVRTITSHRWFEADLPPAVDDGGCGCGHASPAGLLPIALLFVFRRRASCRVSVR